VIASAQFDNPVKVAVLEMVVTWAVRRTLNVSYRRAIGRPVPTARDPDVPFRRIVLWAAVAAAAVAAAHVVVDRVVLRPKQPVDNETLLRRTVEHYGQRNMDWRDAYLVALVEQRHLDGLLSFDRLDAKIAGLPVTRREP
jgi:hypothetical protein